MFAIKITTRVTMSMLGILLVCISSRFANGEITSQQPLRRLDIYEIREFAPPSLERCINLALAPEKIERVTRKQIQQEAPPRPRKQNRPAKNQ